MKPCVSSSLPFPRIVASGWCSAHTFVLRLVVHRTFPLASFHQFLLCVLVILLQQFAGLGLRVLLSVAVVNPLGSSVPASTAAPGQSSAAPP